ncbi:MAG TPA: hypothetical protein ENI05_16000 [Porticoccus sp.]|nr:hypothetical protein [Porticoccus sp.]
MPDIVSNIILKAMGADEAAREILKLEKAYKETGKAAKDVSPEGVSAGDPFARATGGAGAREIAQMTTQREQRTAAYRRNQEARESANQNYNVNARQLPGMVSGAAGAMQQAGAGKMFGAAGGMLASVGGLLGPAGIGMIAAGIGIKAMGDLGGSAFERVQRYWGTGIAQRLGVESEEVSGFAIRAGRTGIPAEMVNTLLQAASGAGFSATKPGATTAAQFGLEAAAMMGVDPGTIGKLLGGVSRAGISGGKLDYEMYGMAKGTFGVENVGMFMSELSRTLEEAMTRGVSLTASEFDKHTKMLGAYAQYGGVSVTGAVAINQMMTQRGAQAGRLQRPEDIIAFQAMRAATPGASITDIMMQMEESPLAVNRAVYDYLKASTGGNQDLLRLRMQSYTGGTMSQTAVMMKTFEGLDRETHDDKKKRYGTLKYAPWRRLESLGEGDARLGSEDEARRYYATEQIKLLTGLEDLALSFKTSLVEFFRGGETDLNIRNATFTSLSFDPTTLEKTGLRTVSEIADDKQLQNQLSKYYRIGAAHTSYNTPEEFKQIVQDRGMGAGGTLGGWASIATEIWTGILEAGREQLGSRVVTPLLSDLLSDEFGGLYALNEEANWDSKSVIKLLERMVDVLEAAGFVYTDESQ